MPFGRRYRRGVDAATIVGLLADPARLKVVAALVLGAGTIEDVADAAGLPLKDVALAARRLARAGLVHRDGHALALHAEQHGGDEEVLEALRNIDDREYEGPSGVSSAVFD